MTSDKVDNAAVGGGIKGFLLPYGLLHSFSAKSCYGPILYPFESNFQSSAMLGRKHSNLVFCLRILASTITNADGTLCVRPQTGGCSPVDDTILVLRNTGCTGDDAQFIFDRSRGSLTHKCSGKLVCPLAGALATYTDLVVSSKCSLTRPYSEHFLRTLCKRSYRSYAFVGGLRIHEI